MADHSTPSLCNVGADPVTKDAYIYICIYITIASGTTRSRQVHGRLVHSGGDDRDPEESLVHSTRFC